MVDRLRKLEVSVSHFSLILMMNVMDNLTEINNEKCLEEFENFIKLHNEEMVKKNISSPQLIGVGKEIEVRIANYPVNINGRQVEVVNSQYLVIVHKEITCFPMTYDFLKAPGLKLNFSVLEGLEIDLDESFVELE